MHFITLLKAISPATHWKVAGPQQAESQQGGARRQPRVLQQPYVSGINVMPSPLRWRCSCIRVIPLNTGQMRAAMDGTGSLWAIGVVSPLPSSRLSPHQSAFTLENYLQLRKWDSYSACKVRELPSCMDSKRQSPLQAGCFRRGRSHPILRLRVLVLCGKHVQRSRRHQHAYDEA